MRWIFGLALLLTLPASCAKSAEPKGDQGSNAPAASGASCVGACGQKSPDESCWCDPECASIGDCCADLFSVCSFPDAGNSSAGGSSSGGSGNFGGTGAGGSGAGGFGGSGAFGGSGSGGVPNTGGLSCVGLCGGSAAGEACWCEPECVSYGDCCPDYAQVCGGGATPTGGGCTPQLCGTATPASQNGTECYCDPACLQYGDCCANAKAVCGF